MTARHPETLDSSATDREAESDRLTGIKRLGSTLAADGRLGPIALLAGGGLLARAIRSATRSRRRAATQGLFGAALIGVALRRRRSAAETEAGVDELLGGASGADAAVEKTVSDDAAAARERHDVRNQQRAESGSNPRGVSEPLADDASTAADEGDVRFTTDGEEPRSKPDLDGPTDPRYRGDEGDGVEIDLSEASLADEASEATGPAPEQSQPVQTEDTEPESSPPEDPSHTEADVPDGSGAGAPDRASDPTDEN